MIDLIEPRREAIRELCARYGVARLEAFGSASRDDFRPGESDLDLLVEFNPMAPYARVDATSAFAINSAPSWARGLTS